MLRSSNIFLVTFLLVLCACDDVRFHCHHTLGGEWSYSDTLLFACYGAGRGDKELSANVELRCNSDYPYRELWIALENVSQEYSENLADTFSLPIYSMQGVPNGATAGLLRQLSIPVGNLDVPSNDTLLLRIYPIMNDDVLPGIYNVGIKLVGCGRHQYEEN